MNAVLLALALAAAAPEHEHEHDHAPELGTLTFETTCNPAADALFERGVRWLHSFEYQRAERSFGEAAAADPTCGIAHWGAALSYYHPLWQAPTAAEFEQGRAALAKARAALPRSQREQGYIAALDSFYRDADRTNHKQRVLAYSAAMEQLHRRYPADDEAAVFYALSLIAAGTLDDDQSYAREKAAGAILNAILARQPDHPGVSHYLIHSFDYPPLASLALPAARRYAGIAPASAHAQHMPSHIFTRLGLWDDAIASNQAAERAARAYAKEAGMADSWDQRLHAMDYLAYAYLQAGRDADAEQVLADLLAITRVDPPNVTAAYAATVIPARLLLERRQWSAAAAYRLPDNIRKLAAIESAGWSIANIHYARGVGAARSGQPELARNALAALEALEAAFTVKPGDYDWRAQIAIQRQVVQAWIEQAEARPKAALATMRAAAEIDDATEKHPVTPGSIQPAREQLGELLLEQKRYAEALAQYEQSMHRAPRRLAANYGAARAARMAGKTEVARKYYEQILDVAKSGKTQRAEVREAADFLRSAAARAGAETARLDVVGN